MPEVAFEVIRVADDPGSTACQVAQTLVKDPSLSARVLRLSNSAFYGMSREVISIQDAVVLLGMRTIKSLSLVAASFPWLERALRGKGLSPETMWKHCLACAYVSKEVAKKCGKADAELAFCVGLLHDIGEVVLCLWCEGDFHRISLEANKSDAPFDAVQRSTIGYDHAEIGAALAIEWNLPEVYSTAIEFHHRPSAVLPHNVLADIIHVSDMLIREIGMTEGIVGSHYIRDPEAFDRLGLTEEELEELRVLAINNLQRSEACPELQAAA